MNLQRRKNGHDLTATFPDNINKRPGAQADYTIETNEDMATDKRKNGDFFERKKLSDLENSHPD